jgi:hypothetical protein
LGKDAQATLQYQQRNAEDHRYEFWLSHCGKIFKHIVKRDQFRTALLVADDRFIKLHLERGPSALCIAAASSVIHEDAPHRLRGYRVEVSSILPSHILVVDESQISLVDQRRGLQGMVGALAAHVIASQPAQLLIHKGNQPIERGLITVAPIHQQSGYRSG